MQKKVTIASITITKIISLLDIIIYYKFSLQDIPWDSPIINQTISSYTLIQWILKEILSKTNKFTFYTGLPHADPYTWKWVLYLSCKAFLAYTYQVKFVCVLWHISETSA